MTNPEIDNYGNQFWYNSNGQFHREDGPAIIHHNGYQAWCINGKSHREDGSAVIYSAGYREWWIGNINYTDNKSFQLAANITDEDMLIINLKYGDVG